MPQPSSAQFALSGLAMLLLPELALGRLEAIFLIFARLLCLGLGELFSVPLFSGLFFGSHSLLHFCLGASGVLLNLPHGLLHVGSSFVEGGLDALFLDVVVEKLPAP
ncbi:hypothetical protein LNN38_10050 [Pseudomonas sp. LA21]|uniref:hypothetical protein n=1 Tax=Pseudomonas sp. LA21 TaxID=2893373 RepID=UPI001FB6455A|nr:hypothetical protein [Pseudomonas sp. LA21]MCJ1885183.1 hypothetical protein [Pseudomonas sp. LA21]